MSLALLLAAAVAVLLGAAQPPRAGAARRLPILPATCRASWWCCPTGRPRPPRSRAAPGRVVVAESLLVALARAGAPRAAGARAGASRARASLAPRRRDARRRRQPPARAAARARSSTRPSAGPTRTPPREVGDRRHVATALARVALLARAPRRGVRLALAAQAVPARVAAMLARPPRARPLLIAAIAAIPLIGGARRARPDRADRQAVRPRRARVRGKPRCLTAVHGHRVSRRVSRIPRRP